MGREGSPIAAHPLVERMQAAAKDGDKVIELQGYPGQSDAQTLTLFLDLSLSRYLEIPLAAIMASSEPEGTAHGPTKVYVRASAQIIAGRRVTAREAAHAASPTKTLLSGKSWQRVCEFDPFLGIDVCHVEPIWE